MPLEIREIAIRMRVGETDAPANDALASPLQHGRDERGRDAIIEECVRRVMATLKTRQER